MTVKKGFFDSTVDLVKKSSNIAKLMMRKSIMERSRKQKFQHLGELTYSLYKTSVIKDATLQELVTEIDQINSEIRQTSGELSDYVYVEKNKDVNS